MVNDNKDNTHVNSNISEKTKDNKKSETVQCICEIDEKTNTIITFCTSCEIHGYPELLRQDRF